MADNTKKILKSFDNLTAKDFEMNSDFEKVLRKVNTNIVGQGDFGRIYMIDSLSTRGNKQDLALKVSDSCHIRIDKLKQLFCTNIKNVLPIKKIPFSRSEYGGPEEISYLYLLPNELSESIIGIILTSLIHRNLTLHFNEIKGVYLDTVNNKVFTIMDQMYNVVDIERELGRSLSTDIDSVNILFQLVQGLGVAQDSFKFTHYDLHSDNVLFTPSQKNLSYIKYPIPQKNGSVKYIWVKNFGYFARIADYGLSRLQYKKTIVSPKIDYFPVKSYGKFNQFYDILSFIGSIMIFGNYDLENFQNLAKIMTNSLKIETLASLLAFMYDKPEPVDKIGALSIIASYVKHVLSDVPDESAQKSWRPAMTKPGILDYEPYKNMYEILEYLGDFLVEQGVASYSNPVKNTDREKKARKNVYTVSKLKEYKLWNYVPRGLGDFDQEMEGFLHFDGNMRVLSDLWENIPFFKEYKKRDFREFNEFLHDDMEKNSANFCLAEKEGFIYSQAFTKGGSGEIAFLLVNDYDSSKLVYSVITSINPKGGFEPSYLPTILKTIELPSNDYVRKGKAENLLYIKDPFSEFIFSGLLGNLYDLGICPFFAKYISGFQCGDRAKLLVEKSDITMYELVCRRKPFSKTLLQNPQILTNILFQYTWGIYIAKYYLGFSHLDTHGRNVMVSILNGMEGFDIQPKKYVYAGQEVNNKKYFVFETSEKSRGKSVNIVIKNIGFLCKIIDLGFAIANLERSQVTVYNKPIALATDKRFLWKSIGEIVENESKFATHDIQYLLNNMSQFMELGIDEIEGKAGASDETAKSYFAPLLDELDRFSLEMFGIRTSDHVKTDKTFQIPKVEGKWRGIGRNRDVGHDNGFTISSLVNGLLNYCKKYGKVEETDDRIYFCLTKDIVASDIRKSNSLKLGLSTTKFSRDMNDFYKFLEYQQVISRGGYNFIGTVEDYESSAFMKRTQQPQNAPLCPKRKYKWAELKSSLLAQKLIQNNDVDRNLVKFYQGITERIFDNLGIDLKSELAKYAKILKTSKPGSKAMSYPLAQSQAWIDDPRGIFSNFLTLNNFLKWFWYNLRDGEYFRSNKADQKQAIFYLSVVKLFQQQIWKINDRIKGKRVLDTDEPGDTFYVGITDLENTSLKRQVRDKPDYEPEPWFHPGRQRCRIPYIGKYGSLMKKYTRENDFYASVQCGISGSVNYNIYLYLLSLENKKYKNSREIDGDIRNLILSLVIIFVGDGGHNVREVIFGFTIAITLMKNIIDDVNKNLQVNFKNTNNLQQNNDLVQKSDESFYLGSLFEGFYEFLSEFFISENLQASIQDENRMKLVLVKKMINMLSSWQPFINRAYSLTKNINITGITRNDLKRTNPQILKNEKKHFGILKEIIYKNIFTKYDPQEGFDEAYTNDLQIFFALENKRFEKDSDASFREPSSKIIESFLSEEFLKSIDGEIKEVIKECKSGIKPSQIPFV